MTSFPSNYSQNLPGGWDEKVSSDGRVFYVDHITKKTQWDHPLTAKRKRVVSSIPPGWEQIDLPNGRSKFINHKKNITTHIDPRLPLVLEEKDYNADVKENKVTTVHQYTYLNYNMEITNPYLIPGSLAAPYVPSSLSPRSVYHENSMKSHLGIPAQTSFPSSFTDNSGPPAQVDRDDPSESVSFKPKVGERDPYRGTDFRKVPGQNAGIGHIPGDQLEKESNRQMRDERNLPSYSLNSKKLGAKAPQEQETNLRDIGKHQSGGGFGCHSSRNEEKRKDRKEKYRSISRERWQQLPEGRLNESQGSNPQPKYGREFYGTDRYSPERDHRDRSPYNRDFPPERGSPNSRYRSDSVIKKYPNEYPRRRAPEAYSPPQPYFPERSIPNPRKRESSYHEDYRDGHPDYRPSSISPGSCHRNNSREPFERFVGSRSPVFCDPRSKRSRFDEDFPHNLQEYFLRDQPSQYKQNYFDRESDLRHKKSEEVSLRIQNPSQNCFAGQEDYPRRFSPLPNKASSSERTRSFRGSDPSEKMRLQVISEPVRNLEKRISYPGSSQMKDSPGNNPNFVDEEDNEQEPGWPSPCSSYGPDDKDDREEINESDGEVENEDDPKEPDHSKGHYKKINKLLQNYDKKIIQKHETKAIIADGFPKFGSLSRDQAAEVEKFIIKKLDELDPEGSIHPRFAKWNYRVGAMLVSCLDYLTLNWLEEVLKGFTLSDGIKVAIRTPKVVRGSSIIGGFFKYKYAGEEKFLEELSNSNPKFDMSLWTVLQTDPVKNGTCVSLGVPKTAIGQLHSYKNILMFRSEIVNIRVLSKKNSGKRPPRQMVRKFAEDVILGLV